MIFPLLMKLYHDLWTSLHLTKLWLSNSLIILSPKSGVFEKILSILDDARQSIFIIDSNFLHRISFPKGLQCVTGMVGHHNTLRQFKKNRSIIPYQCTAVFAYRYLVIILDDMRNHVLWIWYLSEVYLFYQRKNNL